MEKLLRKMAGAAAAVVFAAFLAGCSSGSAVHRCAAPDCSNEGTMVFLDENGEKQVYCEEHYLALVPADQQTAVPSAPRDPSLCELCDLEAVLTYTDETETEHRYCTEHYTQVVQQKAESSAEQVQTERVCDICGKPAILSTKTGEDGQEHFYCTEHYGEMLDILG